MSAKHRTILIVIAAIILGLLVNYHKNIIQAYNISRLCAKQLDGRLAPHRINDLHKLEDILAKGLHSAEVDLYFREAPTGGRYEVGHDDSEFKYLILDSVLERLRPTGIARIWLDIKNLSDQNIDDALVELLRLDSLFQIKEKAIVESGTTSDAFARIAEAGFHTSYYLPSGTLLESRSIEDEAAIQAVFQGIADQLRRQRAAAVSFDLGVYCDVKSRLEPLVGADVIYHVWGVDKMWRWRAIDRVQRTDYFRDERVGTILYRLW